MKAEGRCETCGKPCAPFTRCEEHREIQLKKYASHRKKWAQKNKSRTREYRRKYYLKYKDKIMEKQREYRKRKRLEQS